MKRRVKKSRGSRTRSKKNFKKRVSRVVKSVALRNLETKQHVRWVPDPPSTFQSLPNVLNSAGGLIWGTITKGIGQGVDEFQRTGNEITLKGTTIRLATQIATPGSGSSRFPSDFMFRFLVLKINPGYAPVWAAGSTRPTANELFQDGTTSGMSTWFTKSVWDNDGIIQKVYIDKNFSLKYGNQNTYDSSGVVRQLNEPTRTHKFHIDWHNTKFQFAGTSDEFGTKCDLIWVVIPWNRNYAVGTAAVMGWLQSRKTWFKDG